MRPIRFFTERSVDELRSGIAEHLDWYYSGDGDLAERWPESRDSRVERRSAALTLDDRRKKPHLRDSDNALRVHDHLGALTPHEASEERLWVYLCHVECADYLRVRWLGKRPKKTEEAVGKVRNHFFARGARGLMRDNGISRLWWMGKIARDADEGAPERFLEIVLHRQDVRSSLLERPLVSRNVRILRAIYGVMRERWEGDSDAGLLFQREAFRAWMRGINLRGGVVLLDALTPATLRALLEEEAERAIAGDDR